MKEYKIIEGNKKEVVEKMNELSKGSSWTLKEINIYFDQFWIYSAVMEKIILVD